MAPPEPDSGQKAISAMRAEAAAAGKDGDQETGDAATAEGALEGQIDLGQQDADESGASPELKLSRLREQDLSPAELEQRLQEARAGKKEGGAEAEEKKPLKSALKKRTTEEDERDESGVDNYDDLVPAKVEPPKPKELEVATVTLTLQDGEASTGFQFTNNMVLKGARPGSAADRANLQSRVGWKLTHVNDVPVSTLRDCAAFAGKKILILTLLSPDEDFEAAAEEEAERIRKEHEEGEKERELQRESARQANIELLEEEAAANEKAQMLADEAAAKKRKVEKEKERARAEPILPGQPRREVPVEEEEKEPENKGDKDKDDKDKDDKDKADEKEGDKDKGDKPGGRRSRTRSGGEKGRRGSRSPRRRRKSGSGSRSRSRSLSSHEVRRRKREVRFASARGNEYHIGPIRERNRSPTAFVRENGRNMPPFRRLEVGWGKAGPYADFKRKLWDGGRPGVLLAPSAAPRLLPRLREMAELIGIEYIVHDPSPDGPRLDGVLCRNGHPMTGFTSPEEWCCSSCGSKRLYPPGSSFYGCRLCEHDLCGGCVNKAVTVSASIATVVALATAIGVLRRIKLKRKKSRTELREALIVEKEARLQGKLARREARRRAEEAAAKKELKKRRAAAEAVGKKRKRGVDTEPESKKPRVFFRKPSSRAADVDDEEDDEDDDDDEDEVVEVDESSAEDAESDESGSDSDAPRRSGPATARVKALRDQLLTAVRDHRIRQQEPKRRERAVAEDPPRHPPRPPNRHRKRAGTASPPPEERRARESRNRDRVEELERAREDKEAELRRLLKLQKRQLKKRVDDY